MALDLSSFFYPESIAILGASNKEGKTGHTLFKNIIEGGYQGEVFPVNPRGGTILGHKAYQSLSEIEGEVDLALFIIPAKFVPQAMKEAGEKGVKGAIIISGGFREAGNQALEDELVEIAREYDIRLVGPNCQGINFTGSKLCASWPLITSQGSIAIISQSGTIGASVAIKAEEENCGISGFVSLGNRVDVDESDLMEFFAMDEKTQVIVLYLEGVANGQKFIETAKRVTREKPVLVLKGGRTELGQLAAESHTKSMAGKDAVFEGACRQAGITRLREFNDLYLWAKILGSSMKRGGSKLLIITSSGGSGILSTDIAVENGMTMAKMSEETLEALKERLPDYCIFGNPLDLTGDTDAKRFEEAALLAAEDPEVDLFLFIFGDPIPGAFEVVEGLKEKISQEILVCYWGGGEVEYEETLKFQRANIPVLSTPEEAAKAAVALAHGERGEFHGEEE